MASCRYKFLSSLHSIPLFFSQILSPSLSLSLFSLSPLPSLPVFQSIRSVTALVHFLSKLIIFEQTQYRATYVGVNKSDYSMGHSPDFELISQLPRFRLICFAIFLLSDNPTNESERK